METWTLMHMHKKQQTALYSQDIWLWLLRTATIIMIKADSWAIVPFYVRILLTNGFTKRKCSCTSSRSNIWIQWKHVGKERGRNTVSLLCVERIHNPICVWTVQPGELGWAARTLAELKRLELRITSKLAGTESRSRTLVFDQGPACAFLIMPANKTSEPND